MSIVTLVSGGLDSAVMAVMAKKDGVEQYPLFVDYGHRACNQEWRACLRVFREHHLPKPVRADAAGFGALVPSGLTNARLDVVGRAFLPGRNLLFLLLGAAYAVRVKASGVAIGLLDESQRLFEDQSKDFLARAQGVLRTATDSSIAVTAPLIHPSKAQVLALARGYKVSGTYSCHTGGKKPCGRCLSCRERLRAEKEDA